MEAIWKAWRKRHTRGSGGRGYGYGNGGIKPQKISRELEPERALSPLKQVLMKLVAPAP